MASKKKFYAVARGRKPGIYTNWPDAARQVKDFHCAVFKGFETRKEAEHYMKYPPKPFQKQVKFIGVKPKPGQVVIFTDGGSKGNPGPGGWGAILMYADKRKEISGGFRKTNNNRMELMACIEALETLKRPCEDVVLYSESQYAIKGIKEGWAKKWKLNGWMNSSNRPAVNSDLWKRLLKQCDRHTVYFVLVKGHSGIPDNDRCDELVCIESAKEGQPPDEQYEKMV